MYTFLLIIFVIDVLLLIPIILMQSGSGAEAGMFGSNLTMGAFGAKTSEVLTNFTKILVGIFMVLAFLLGYLKIVETKNITPDIPSQTIESSESTAVDDTTVETGLEDETGLADEPSETTIEPEEDEEVSEQIELPGIDTSAEETTLPLGDPEDLKLDF